MKSPLIAGLDNSVAIGPFAAKGSRLESEKILSVDCLALHGDWKLRLADRVATEPFFKADTADAAGVTA